MKKKIRFAAILQFVAAALYVFTLVFIRMDIEFFQIGFSQTEGWDGLGLAIIFALALIFQYTTSAIALFFHALVGALMCSAAKKGKLVHKALRVLLVVFVVIATLVNLFFVYSYFDVGAVLWGLLTAVSAIVSIVAMCVMGSCKAETVVPVLENPENMDVEG